MPVSELKKENNLFFIYSNFGIYKTIYNNVIIPMQDIRIRINIFIPETKININQFNPINKVCPKSGCKTSKSIIDNVKKKDIRNFIVKLEKFLFVIIKDNTIIKKGFTNSIGCNLGKKNSSSHLVEPFTSTPIKGTKINKVNDAKKI